MTCMLHTPISVCGFRVAHTPLDSVLHTSLSVCAFRVAHIPLDSLLHTSLWIPCCTHPFLCVDSLLHTCLYMCGFLVAHIPFCVCIPCCTHPFGFRVAHIPLHSVLHTSLSVCAFRVTHIPFCVCIPCYTHPFLCVHSVLHTSLWIPCCTNPPLCVHSVLHTCISVCAFRVTHISFYVCIPCCAQWTVRCGTRAGVAKIINRRRTAGRRATLRTPCSVPSSVECVPVSCVYCPILCGVCPGELCILSHPLWSVSG